jgi:hypothetical protein
MTKDEAKSKPSDTIPFEKAIDDIQKGSSN